MRRPAESPRGHDTNAPNTSNPPHEQQCSRSLRHSEVQTCPGRTATTYTLPTDAPSRLHVRERAVDDGLGVARLRGDGRVRGDDGVVEAAQLDQRVEAPAQRRREPRVVVERALERCQRLVDLAQLLQRDGAVVPALDVRLEAVQRLVVRLNRLGRVAQLLQRDASVGVDEVLLRRLDCGAAVVGRRGGVDSAAGEPRARAGDCNNR